MQNVQRLKNIILRTMLVQGEFAREIFKYSEVNQNDKKPSEFVRCSKSSASREIFTTKGIHP